MLEINAKINDETAEQLAYIQQQTAQEINEIFKLAIENYYQLINPQKNTAFELLEKSGFIGCCSVETELSTTYKSVLKEELKSKYDHS